MNLPRINDPIAVNSSYGRELFGGSILEFVHRQCVYLVTDEVNALCST
jgi:hypothetical protein